MRSSCESIHRRRWAFYLLATVFVFFGCAEASLYNVKHAEVGRPLRRLAVFVATGLLGHEYAAEMVRALLEKLTPFCDGCRGDVLTGLELDPEAPFKTARAFQADGVLLLEPIGGVIVEAEEAADVTYRVVVVETDSRRPTWTGRAEHKGSTARVRRRTQLAAEKIVAAMAADGVLAEVPKAQHAQP